MQSHTQEDEKLFFHPLIPSEKNLLLVFGFLQDERIGPAAELLFCPSSGVRVRLPKDRSRTHNVRTSSAELRRQNSYP